LDRLRIARPRPGRAAPVVERRLLRRSHHPDKDSEMKIILWIVGIIFLIGLLVVFGLGSLIF
jgi:hypothetical protein